MYECFLLSRLRILTVFVMVTTSSATFTKPKLNEPEGTSRSQATTGAERARSTRTSPPPILVMGANAPVKASFTISV